MEDIDDIIKGSFGRWQSGKMPGWREYQLGITVVKISFNISVVSHEKVYFLLM
jgi:hypothetical protein